MNMKLSIILPAMVLVVCGSLAAGTLEPAGPPAPTMKTLNEVEARIPIRPSEMPITIGNPGSYYLTGNFTASSATHAIFISAEHVTVDLNGYSLNGNNKLGRDAIQIDASMKYTTIRNGYIFNWSGNGINGEEAERTYVEDVHVDTVTNEGIFLASGTKAIGCSATNCGEGFTLGSDSIAVRCTARNNTNNGFGTWGNCLLAECIASGNGTNGLDKAQTPAQAEPRIPINADTAPGNSAFEYVISRAGSYYLTADVSTAKSGISVDVDDVTIDLMGFTISGPDVGIRNGVYMYQRNNVQISNGTIRDFSAGIYEAITTGKNHKISYINAVSNTVSGIVLLGTNCRVENCTSSDNGTGSTSHVYGIRAGENAMVSSNTVEGNGYSTVGAYVYGIYTSSGSTVTDNTVCNNGSSGGNRVYGIVGAQSSMITDNNIRKNGTSAQGNVYGISASYGSVITGNAVYDNGDSSLGGNVYGILSGVGTCIKANTAYSNGTNADGEVHGFNIGKGSTVEGNTAAENGDNAIHAIPYGYYVDTGCTVIGNTAYSNGTSTILTHNHIGFLLLGKSLLDQNTSTDHYSDFVLYSASGASTTGLNHGL